MRLRGPGGKHLENTALASPSMQVRERTHLVFVYGSLRRGNTGAMSIRFPDSEFIAGAQVQGSLYDLGAYPGLLLDGSSSVVKGEVYEVDEDTLQKLDQFELSSDYIRHEVEINVGTERKQSWIYVPDSDADFYSDCTLIKSGDWLEYVRTKS